MGEQNQMLEAATCLATNIGRGLAAIAEAVRENAVATDRLAEATFLQARATAGEFDEAEDVPEPAKPGQGMGMGGFTVIELLVVLALVAIFAAIVWGAFHQSPTIELNRDKWTCVELDTVRGTRIQPVGKTLVAIPTSTQQCVLWRRLDRDDG